MSQYFTLKVSIPMTHPQWIPAKPEMHYEARYDATILRYVHMWSITVQQEVTRKSQAGAPFGAPGILLTFPEAVFNRYAYVKSKSQKRYNIFKAWYAKRCLRREYACWYRNHVENGQLKIIDDDESPGGMRRA